MPKTREKFATQVSPEILASIRRIAEEESCQIQALVDEALTDLVEKRKRTRPRPHVMAAYASSHGTYAELYKKLAK